MHTVFIRMSKAEFLGWDADEILGVSVISEASLNRVCV